MRAVLFFGAGSWLTFLIACATSIYAFGLYEHAWGRGGSFQVEAWLSLLGALVAAGSFGIAAAFTHRAHSPAAALALGAACSALFVAICWVLSSFEPSGGVYVALLLLVLISGLASYTGQPVGG